MEGVLKASEYSFARLKHEILTIVQVLQWTEALDE